MTLVGKSAAQQGRAGHGSANHDVHSCELCDQIESELAPTKPTRPTKPTKSTELAKPTEPAKPAKPAVRSSQKTTANPGNGAAGTPSVPVLARTVEVPRPPGAEPPPAASRVAAVPVPPREEPREEQPESVAATAGAPERVVPSADRPPTPRRPGRTILLICAVVAIVAAGSVAFALLRSSGGSKSPDRAAPVSAPAGAGTASAASTPAALNATVAAAIEWARVELPHDLPLVGDAQTQSALVAAGFTQVAHVSSTTSSIGAFGYLFDTPSVRAAAPGNPAISAALASSVAVAEFGSAADQVDVRQAVTDSAAVVGARRAADATTRQTAEQELLRNPAVTAGGNAVAALQQGQLDLRAATVLAYLANSTTVRVSNVSVNGPEQLAGLPVRSIDVTIGAPAVMQTIVSGLPVAYQPTSVTQLSTGAVRMVWPIAGEPLPGLS